MGNSIAEDFFLSPVKAMSLAALLPFFLSLRMSLKG
jgi:hypothetical protein